MCSKNEKDIIDMLIDEGAQLAGTLNKNIIQRKLFCITCSCPPIHLFSYVFIVDFDFNVGVRITKNIHVKNRIVSRWIHVERYLNVRLKNETLGSKKNFELFCN